MSAKCNADDGGDWPSKMRKSEFMPTITLPHTFTAGNRAEFNQRTAAKLTNGRGSGTWAADAKLVIMSKQLATSSMGLEIPHMMDIMGYDEYSEGQLNQMVSDEVQS
jgi:hypothetical protein